MISTRIQQVQTILRQQPADGILVTDPRNIFYLSGFRGTSTEEMEASLLVTIDQAWLVVPRMYQQQVEKLEAVKAGQIQVQVTQERDGLLLVFLSLVPPSFSTILLEDQHVRWQQAKLIQQKVDESESSLVLQPAKGIIETLRQCKDSQELSSIRQAVSLTDQVLEQVIRWLELERTKRFVSEQEVAAKIRTGVFELGGEDLSFSSIVASNEGSAEPHYRTGAKILPEQGVLLIDLGVMYQGYTGDLTRCFFLGEEDKEVKRIYALVQQCQQAVIEHCRSGVKAGDLQQVAVDFFKQHQVDQYFIHSVGHGVGLHVHEEPFLRQSRDLILQSGMIITVEPGLYFPGKFGLRLEDYLLITDNGCEVLSQASSKMQVI